MQRRKEQCSGRGNSNAKARGENELGVCGLMQERQPHRVYSESPRGGVYILFYEDKEPLEGAAVMDLG